MKRGWKWAIGAVAVLGACAGVVVFQASRPYRGHLSSSLSFLNGLEPSYVDREGAFGGYRGPSTLKRPTQGATVEVFDLKKPYEEVRLLARAELKARAYVAGTTSWTTVYGVHDDTVNVVVTIEDDGEGKTGIRIVTPNHPGPLDRFFAWVRRVCGVKA